MIGQALRQITTLGVLLAFGAATAAQAQEGVEGPAAPPLPQNFTGVASSMKPIGGGPEESSYPDPRNFGGIWGPVVARSKHPYSIDDPPAKQPILDRLARDREARRQGKVVGTAWTTCRPGSIIVSLFPFFLVSAIQTDDSLTLMFENPRLVRRIWLDRPHSKAIKASYVGESVGRFEGNTLVVDTVGFNGIPELDTLGLPAGPKTHVVERFTKASDGKSLTIETTITDPDNYTRPIELHRIWRFVSGDRQTEYDCAENVRSEERDETLYLKPLYRPICVREEAEGEAQSKVVCRRDRPRKAVKP